MSPIRFDLWREIPDDLRTSADHHQFATESAQSELFASGVTDAVALPDGGLLILNANRSQYGVLPPCLVKGVFQSC